MKVPGEAEHVRRRAEDASINFNVLDADTISIALNETLDTAGLRDIVGVFATALGKRHRVSSIARQPQASLHYASPDKFPNGLRRSSTFLTHPVFNTHHSETEMMRYIRSLERKDLGLDTSMIPLGSCTMKLNAATEMLPITWDPFSRMHPFAPDEQTEGYVHVFSELEAALCEITGFAEVSLQPNSGAQGEFTGLMVIRAYHRDRGEPDATSC